MEEKTTWKNEYYTLINSLPRLSQEEIVSLYESENIPYTDLDLEIKKIQDKIETETDTESLEAELEDLKREKPSISYRYYLTLVGRRHNVRRYPSRELRNKIVEGTMYLVTLNAALVYKLRDNHLEFDDLVQYGMEALLSAAYYYIPGGEATFKTYASKCIRNKMLRTMRTSKNRRKAKDFFKRERLKIVELKMLLEVEKYNPKYGSGYYSNTEEHLIIHRLNRRIIRYNRAKDRRMEHDLKLCRVYSKTFDEIFDRYSKLIKSTKLRVLITDEERRDIESYLAHTNVGKGDLNYFRAQLYLELYEYKLDLLESYIAAEKTLLERGEEPSVDNIFKKINENIRKTNNRISRLRSSGFFQMCESGYIKGDNFYYKPLKSFYKKYLEMYGINLLGKDNSQNSRNVEKEMIIADYKKLQSYYEYFIDVLSRMDSSEVYVYLYEDNTVADIIPYVPFESLTDKVRKQYSDEKSYYSNQTFSEYKVGYPISRHEMLTILTEEREALGSEEEYLKRILRERSDRVNESLAKENAPIIKENIRIKMMEDLHNLGKKYHKYLKEKEIERLSRDFNLFYNDDPDLIDLLLERDKNRSKRLTVEEEVINNLFLEDYYEALNGLDDLERKIMLLYYNSNGCSTLTLREIADILGIKLYKVKRVKAKALLKLRKNEKLISYFNEE